MRTNTCCRHNISGPDTIESVNKLIIRILISRNLVIPVTGRTEDHVNAGHCSCSVEEIDEVVLGPGLNFFVWKL